MISSYEAAVLHMTKARNVAKGRPMKGSGWRLFQDGYEYVVQVRGVQVGRFLTDNTFMFTLTGETAYPVAQVLACTMDRNLPFCWCKVKHGAYRVDHKMGMITTLRQHFENPTNAPLVYDGLIFNLFNGKRLNYRPDPKPVVDPAKRKEWLAASGAWKRKLKVAARVGVFDGLIAQEKKNRTPRGERPQWSRDMWLDILYKAIKDGDCSADLLRMFVASTVSAWGVTPNSMEMYEHVDKIVKLQSLELRKRFGVFKGE